MTDSSPQKKGGWSFFSNAVAGLESRLDTLFDDDSEAPGKPRLSDIAEAKERAEQEAEAERLLSLSKKTTLAPPAPRDSRETSRSRATDRLAERLARATAAKSGKSSQAGSEVGSRTESPAVESESGRASGEEKRSGEIVGRSSLSGADNSETRASVDVSEGHSATGENATDATNDGVEKISIEDTVRVSTESSTRPSIEVTPSENNNISPRPSSDLPNGTLHKTTAELETELTHMREEQTQRQEELHTYLEKIDALQAKLTYLAQQTVAAAKEANNASSSDPAEAKLAEKDEQIAQLMQEGEKLSKTELRQIQTIKKLRSKTAEDEKSAAETKKKLERAEQSEKDLKAKLRRAEVAERQASDKQAKQIATIEKTVEELKTDRENAAELVRNLTVQLKESREETAAAQARLKAASSNEADKSRIATLENELEDAQIEKKLAETRLEADLKSAREEGEKLKQGFGVRELELRNEIGVLESRVEVLRSRAEEAASGETGGTGESGGGEVREGGGVVEGSGNSNVVKLLRQVETLQSQYALAKENWEVIEGSLQSRLAVLEGERDESQRREGEARKKVREIVGKARRAEEENEVYGERIERLEGLLEGKVEESRVLGEKCEGAERKLEDVRVELERERRSWEEELRSRVEEERMKWQQRNGMANTGVLAQQQGVSRNGSPSPITATHSRKPSNPIADLRRPTSSRVASNDLTALRTDIPSQHQQRPTSRQSSGAFPSNQQSATKPSNSPSFPRPGMSRQESNLSAFDVNVPPTPSIEIDNQIYEPFEMTETPTGMHNTNSPDRTINDLVSTSTTPAAGPSVQLVERMSAAVRRLESEKAASKDELARLTTQRDSARDEVVSLMREVEVKRDAEKRAGAVEGEMETLKGRYDASLEMLGEREEEVEELRADVTELKRLYRELVQEKMGDGGGVGSREGNKI